MSIYAIADLHLSLGVNKPMDVFSGWDNYLERLEKNWKSLVKEEDTVVIAGDISWAMSLEETKQDFAFLESLPGEKLILKGNHDFWWSTKNKMTTFFEENGFHSLKIIHNDAVAVTDVAAICGSRGWFFDSEEGEDKKIVFREAARVKTSIQAAKETGLEPIAFLHYPPVYGEDVVEEIWAVLKEENIKECYYGHIHGPGIKGAFEGEKEGIALRLISCDALQFCPIKIR